MESSTKNVVLSLAKGFSVLESFHGADHGMTLTEISQRAHLDPGTTFRLIRTLLQLGYLEQVPGAKRYTLALKVLDLGFTAISQKDFHSSARPILRSLVGEVNEASSIGTLDGGDIVYIERVRAGMARLGVDIRIGSRIPAYCSALGHSVLAWLPEERRHAILSMRERVRLTPLTLVTLSEIEERLQLVRKQGYALSDGETVTGLRVLAAPILDADEHPYGAISVTAPSIARPVDEFVYLTRNPLLRAAKDLSSLLRLGGSATVAKA